MELSQKLKELRKKQGLTQLELAERLFVSRQAISGWEAGTSRPSTENLQSLSKLYNVPLEMLLDDAEAAGPEPEKIPEEERPEKEKHEPGPDKARRKDDKKKKRLVVGVALILIIGMLIVAITFVGPNGSGKTMLLRLIAGFIKPSDGKITMPRAIRKGVIIENPAFIDEFSGFENLCYLASISKTITPEKIKAEMKTLGLDPEDMRKVKIYSLGMKQKLALIQATMELPELLILDEPTRGLDGDSVEIVYSKIKQYSKKGMTVFIASHSKKDIETLCDVVYIIQNGTIEKTQIADG